MCLEEQPHAVSFGQTGEDVVEEGDKDGVDVEEVEGEGEE